MKKIYTTLLCFALSGGYAYSQCTNEWVNYGSPPKMDFGQGTAEGNAVATDASGNIYAAGSFRDSLTLNNDTLITPGTDGRTHSFLVKYDSTSNMIWYKTGISTANSKSLSVADIAVDQQENSYVLGKCWPNSADFDGTSIACAFGECMEEIFLAKYNSSGTLQWVFRTKTSVNREHRPGGIAIKNNGNIIITGTFEYETNFESINVANNGTNNIFIAEIDGTDGSPVWATPYFNAYFYGDNYGEATSVAIDNDDNIYITGDFADDNIVLETDTISAIGGNDLFVIKTNPVGNVVWARDFKPTSNCSDGGEGKSIKIFNNEVYVLANKLKSCDEGDTILFGEESTIINGCASPSSAALFIVKTDTAGTMLDILCTGNTTTAHSGRYIDPVDMVMSSSGQFIVTGIYTKHIYLGTDTLYSAGNMFVSGSNSDTYIAAFDNSGNYLWVESAFSSKKVEAMDVAIFDDRIYVSGFFNDTTTFGTNSPIVNMGDKDYFLWNVCNNSVPTSIQDIDSSIPLFSVYPNPATDHFTIDMRGKQEQTVLTIYNSFGQKLKQVELPDKTQHTLQIANLPAGIYFWQVQNQSTIIQTGKIIIH